MKGRCPKCGTVFQLHEAAREKDQKEIQDIAAKLGRNWEQVSEYVELFRQSEYGDILPKTRWRLIREIAALFDSCTFWNKGKRYRTHEHEIVKAMRTMCNMNKWGQKSHGYLYAILEHTADRLSAEGLTAREEQEREQERIRGQRAEDRGQRTEVGGRRPERFDFRRGLAQMSTDKKKDS